MDAPTVRVEQKWCAGDFAIPLAEAVEVQKIEDGVGEISSEFQHDPGLKHIGLDQSGTSRTSSTMSSSTRLPTSSSMSSSTRLPISSTMSSCLEPHGQELDEPGPTYEHRWGPRWKQEPDPKKWDLERLERALASVLAATSPRLERTLQPRTRGDVHGSKKLWWYRQPDGSWDVEYDSD